MEFCPDVLMQKLQQDVSFIHPSDDLKLYKATVLKSTLLKKYVPEGANDLLDRAAVEAFIDRNEKLSDKFYIPLHRGRLFEAWKNRIYDSIMSEPFQASALSLNQCFLTGKPGKGATRGTRFTDFNRKMWNSDLTCTNELLVSHFDSSLSDRWAQASRKRKERFSYRQVYGSSLSSVPKDSKKNRCICTEPALNMFYQLGAHSILARILARDFRLDIRFQSELNKKAAQVGSIDGSNATIDLSDASDHIHYDLVKQLFPPEAFRVLDVLRSPGFESSGKQYKFNMISSMGNGYTFALMTFLIVTLLDVFLVANNDRYIPGRDGVFGDDIILPARFANEFMSVLSDFGFIVNLNKSYSTGFFRESCGGDFFHGHNVRGIYIKRMNNEGKIYSAFNRLLVWSIRNSIPLHRTLLYIKGLAQFRPVPLHEGDDAGIRVPLEFTTGRKRDENGAVYYRPLVSIKLTYRVSDKSFNHFGAYISALGGYVRRQTVGYRFGNDETTVRYKVGKRKVTPSWDFSHLAELKTQEFRRFWLLFVSD